MAKEQTNYRERTRISHKYPRMYNVIMHNDDFTPMDFVVMVLKTVFYKGDGEAERLMLDVHQKGQAVVGQYTLDVAVSKSQKAMRMARDQGYPFKLSWEPNNELPF